MPHTTKKLYILTQGLSRSEKNTLQVILPRRLQVEVDFEPINEQMPDLILANVDHAEVAKNWQQLQTNYPNAKIIFLAYSGTGPKGYPVLSRPVKMDQLVETIERLQAKSHPGAFAKPPKAQVVAPPATAAPTFKTFEPHHKLIGRMLTAQQRCKHSKEDILVEGMGIFLFMKNGMIFTNNNPKILQSLCVPELHPEAFNIRTVSSQEAQFILGTHKNGHFFQREPFLWDVARYCSRGALPSNLNPSQPMTLVRWPDCTRLSDPLLSTSISAVFAQRPISLVDAIERTGIAERQVIEYASAAYLLNQLSTDSQVIRNTSKTKPAKWSANILGRLAHRIAGKLFG